MSYILRISDNKVLAKTNQVIKSGTIVMVSNYVTGGGHKVELKNPFKAKVSNMARLGERPPHYTDRYARKVLGKENHFRLV